jgi:hypothetical protein
MAEWQHALIDMQQYFVVHHARTRALLGDWESSCKKRSRRAFWLIQAICGKNNLQL